jgi:hypothetical protein
MDQQRSCHFLSNRLRANHLYAKSIVHKIIRSINQPTVIRVNLAHYHSGPIFDEGYKKGYKKGDTPGSFFETCHFIDARVAQWIRALAHLYTHALQL